MHRSEERELLSCASCGAELSAVSDRVFVFGGESALCFECSLERGGRYDAARDRWTVAPRVDDLPPAED
jgi:hypothetical protein